MRKSFWDRKAEKLADKLNEEPKKNDSKEDAKDQDDKSKSDDKKSSEQDKADSAKSDSEDKSKKDEPKDAKSADDKKDDKENTKDQDDKSKSDSKTSDSKSDKSAVPTPAAPASKNYTGAGDISGVKDLRQEVVINGDVTVKQYGGAPVATPQIGAKLDAFVESINAIEFTRAEEESFRNGDALYELKRAREEGEVPGAVIKFAELAFLKCPKKASKFIRDHISEAIEADPELLAFIHEADARKHQIERRFRPLRAELSNVLWTEAEARPYIEEEKAGLPPRLAANARDEDFGNWLFVEINGDTGAIRELSETEAAPHKAKWEQEVAKTPASGKTNKKKSSDVGSSKSGSSKSD